MKRYLGKLLGLCLCIVGVGLSGCIDKVERVCDAALNGNESCLGTKEPHVCYLKKCLPKVCEPGKTKACFTGDAKNRGKGECKDGLQFCVKNGSAWSDCTGETVAIEEFCDGKDNNCDGKVDEGLACECKQHTFRPCYTGVKDELKATNSNLCRKGVQLCMATSKGDGKWGACKSVLRPALYPEQIQSCQIRDANCDGVIDTKGPECACKKGDSPRPCYAYQKDLSSLKAPCKAGEQRCVETDENTWRWSRCEGQVLPEVEECNGKDDDCDGKVDNWRGTETPLWEPCTKAEKCGVKLCVKGTPDLCMVLELCGNKLDDDCDGHTDESDCKKL